MQVDFGMTVADDARYRAGFPGLLLGELAARGVACADTAVLDLGTGTGTLARGFAARSARVVAVDAADDFPADPLDVPHRLWAVLAVKP